ncbi:MAG: CoA pyrophosphatase [Caldilineae bacterium]|nr:MAG: CoA pyrophosphatase [Caldilineae bacterium]
MKHDDSPIRTPFPPLIQALATRLRGPLPGRPAQARMAPRPRPGWDPSFRPPVPPREGGVLVLLYPCQDELCLPLIRRTEYNGAHSGQISLPGGAREPSDPDLIATAIREAHEEIGVDPKQITVLGTLTPLYIWASNFQVQPAVGWTPNRPAFQIDPREVAELLEVAISDLQNPANRHEEEWELRGHKVHVPFFKIHNHIVWGATAMILSELLAVMEEKATLS